MINIEDGKAAHAACMQSLLTIVTYNTEKIFQVSERVSIIALNSARFAMK